VKLERFVAINAPAAEAASRALARMTRRPATVKLLNANLVRLPDDRPGLDREELVVGVYLAIVGGLEGAALLCFQEQKAVALTGMLVGTAAGSSSRLTVMDESALMELGNIICGNYVTELSNSLEVKVLPGLPHFARGMFGSMLEQVIARHALDAQVAVLIDVELDLPAGVMLGHLLLCFKMERLISD
jgi:chemotaxis protein CheC